jgi:lysophospholipase L1-like esterase
MKKILFLLFLSALVKAQIVPNQLTTTNYTKTIGYNGNYNRGALQDWDAKISKIQQATASSTASVIWIGDSWTMNGTFAQPVSSYLRSKFGDGGVGYYGASTLNAGSIYGSGNQTASITRVGNWANVGLNSFIMSAACTADSSSTLGDSLYYVGVATDFVVHYMNKSSGGSFVVRVDGTSPTTVSTSGATSFSTTSKTGLTDGTHTLSIKVSSAGSGVLINGVEINRNQIGVRVHNLGSSGSTSSQWVLQNSANWALAIQQLAPNLAVIQLGVNDCATGITPTTYISNITTIVNRVLAAMPRCAILISSPSDIGAATTYPMSSYISVLKNYALANNYGFIDNYSLIGGYSNANTRGLYTNTTHINNTGGELLKQNMLNYFMNGQSMYYSNGNSFALGEGALINSLITYTPNFAIGTNTLKNLKTGILNTGVGYASLFTGTTFSNVTSFGALAGYYNTASNNDFFGKYAGQNNAGGTGNAYFGTESGLNNVSGNFNTYMGGSSGRATTGSNNTCIGYGAAYATGAVSNVTAVGFLANYANSTGSNGVFIGSYAGRYNTLSNRLFINDRDRTNIAGDTTKSIISGIMAALPANQLLKINAHTSVLHLAGNSSAPTATVGGGAGVSATYTLTNCTDVAGKISVTSATLPNTDDTVITLSFNTAYTSAPTVILTPANKLTANLAKGQEVFATTSTTQLIITSNGTALGTPVIYAWNYLIVQ